MGKRPFWKLQRRAVARKQSFSRRHSVRYPYVSTAAGKTYRTKTLGKPCPRCFVPRVLAARRGAEGQDGDFQGWKTVDDHERVAGEGFQGSESVPEAGEFEISEGGEDLVRGQLAAEVRKMKKMSRSAALAVNVGGVAFAIECLELILVDKGVLRDNELMERIQLETKKRTEAIKNGNHGRICSTDVDF